MCAVTNKSHKSSFSLYMHCVCERVCEHACVLSPTRTIKVPLLYICIVCERACECACVLSPRAIKVPFLSCKEIVGVGEPGIEWWSYERD